MSLVIPGIYIGSKKEAGDKEWLKDHGIKSVLNCAEEINLPPPRGIIATKLWLDDADDQKITDVLPQAARFIDASIATKRPILIHCAAGISRSASILIYWLMTRKFRGSFNNALSFLQKKRSIVNPNPGFKKQLRQMSKEFTVVKKAPAKKKSTKLGKSTR
jgi:protein tyrosine phosphatase